MAMQQSWTGVSALCFMGTRFYFSWRWQHLRLHSTTPVISAAIFGSSFPNVHEHKKEYVKYLGKNKTKQQRFLACRMNL